jgi:hypothetical protein
MEKLDDVGRMTQAMHDAAEAIPHFTLPPKETRVFFDTILGLPQLWFLFDIRQDEPPLVVQMISSTRSSSKIIAAVNQALENACESRQGY